MTMNRELIQVGNVYEGPRGRKRRVERIEPRYSGDMVHFTAVNPVKNQRRSGVVGMATFQQWAGRDVTDDQPF